MLPRQQQSTHDILNLGDTMESKPKPGGAKLSKQESLFSGILGGTNNDIDDHLGLYTFGDPNHNDLLNLNGNTPESSQTKPKGQFSQSTGALDHTQQKQANDDFFGEIWGLSQIIQQHHQSINPQTPPQIGSVIVKKSKTKNKEKFTITGRTNNGELNKPSYIGHGASNGVSLINSSTQNAPSNGAHIKTPELSKEEKEQMANMQLSAKGQAAAQVTYEAAMRERDRKEQERQRIAKETQYWKDKHEQMLNNWEYENTVRRNIRTLIGKLPEILPADLNWKPIPMTKLLNDAQLKKGYYKAVRVVHPDKSTGRSDPIEYQVMFYIFLSL